MKKTTSLLLSLLIPIVLDSTAFAKTETQSQPTAESQTKTETRSFHSKSMMDEAIALIEVYNKIRTIAGKDDRSELKVYLDQTNQILDQILAFKNSFTPQKVGKIEKKLNQVKSDISQMSSFDAQKIRTQTTQLTSSMFDLIKTLMEP